MFRSFSCFHYAFFVAQRKSHCCHITPQPHATHNRAQLFCGNNSNVRMRRNPLFVRMCGCTCAKVELCLYLLCYLHVANTSTHTRGCVCMCGKCNLTLLYGQLNPLWAAQLKFGKYDFHNWLHTIWGRSNVAVSQSNSWCVM